MYILMTGAPGSKWSSVFKNIHNSPDIDNTDLSSDREYYHDADTPGQKQLMHTGAYWDPGMEFDAKIDDWDKPFSGMGRRIIKSHTFAHKLDSLASLGYPIVMVYRNDVECLRWWKLCGEFKITYPNYKYFRDIETMWKHIQRENHDIMQFINHNIEKVKLLDNNHDLCNALNIAIPEKVQDYHSNDIKVYLYE